MTIAVFLSVNRKGGCCELSEISPVFTAATLLFVMLSPFVLSLFK